MNTSHADRSVQSGSTSASATPADGGALSWNLRLQRIWRAFVQAMTTSNEPRITTKVDRQGNLLYYKVYDPMSGRSISFTSETEVKMWLERRYYFL
jgi:hypothetical protein